MGAKWDKDVKSWYVPVGTNLIEKGLDRFSHDNVKTNTVLSLEQQFKEALHSAGLIVENPLMDGKLHRVSVENDKKIKEVVLILVIPHLVEVIFKIFVVVKKFTGNQKKLLLLYL
ncbi:hypothetical protein [Bartonella pachyuromydis]|uniref:DUF5710 domain-containing protein n=1 Tax=Bartonella pachyuromydis TaxID=931097 RepID=A0ABP8VIS1_9HYPH